jgi:hypothetical protein
LLGFSRKAAKPPRKRGIGLSEISDRKILSRKIRGKAGVDMILTTDEHRWTQINIKNGLCGSR